MQQSTYTWLLIFALAIGATLLGCAPREAAEALPPPQNAAGNATESRSVPGSSPTPSAPSSVALSPTPQKTPTPMRTATPVGTPTPVAQRLRGPQSVQPSPRYQPLPLTRDSTLDNRIRQQLGTRITSYGVVVKRLADGRGTVINPDQEFYAASVYKLFVMFEVFKQRELGLLSFDEVLTVTPPYQEFQIGDLRWPLWTEVSIRNLLEAMVTESDNVAAMMLYDKTGGRNMAQELTSIGLTHTDVNTDRLPTSAGDVAILLEMIARKQAINAAASQEMIDLLSRQKIDGGLLTLLPKETKVAHKTGSWDNASHDVGVVYAPSGAYVIAMLSDRAGELKPIAELSRLVYDYFAGTRQDPPGNLGGASRTLTPTPVRQSTPTPAPRR
ncbi:MAG: hypothetical protein EPO21_10180 [Chloroflexota bacterium]|nr:MAG: hypothetical protein EPO21_10180 [Chloroflexota bacterium]